VCAAPLRSDRRTVGPWSSPWPSAELVHESKDEEMVRWLVTYLALVDPWSPDRVGAPLVAFVVLALPCCTETEPDLEDFLALAPSSGLGCGYVGLIVSSWLTLSREGWASAAGGVHPRGAVSGLVGGLMGARACAGLGGVAKGAQIGLHGFGRTWGVELSGDSGGLRSLRRRM
jgi:hypothetical protein